MKIKNIKVENFRLLQNSSLDMTDGLTLIVGKNNTGKTSFVVLLEKFLSKPNLQSNTRKVTRDKKNAKLPYSETVSSLATTIFKTYIAIPESSRKQILVDNTINEGRFNCITNYE